MRGVELRLRPSRCVLTTHATCRTRLYVGDCRCHQLRESEQPTALVIVEALRSSRVRNNRPPRGAIDENGAPIPDLMPADRAILKTLLRSLRSFRFELGGPRVQSRPSHSDRRGSNDSYVQRRCAPAGNLDGGRLLVEADHVDSRHSEYEGDPLRNRGEHLARARSLCNQRRHMPQSCCSSASRCKSCLSSVSLEMSRIVSTNEERFAFDLAQCKFDRKLASVRPHTRKLESLPEEPFFAGFHESLECLFVQDLERWRNDQFGERAPKRFVTRSPKVSVADALNSTTHPWHR